MSLPEWNFPPMKIERTPKKRVSRSPVRTRSKTSKTGAILDIFDWNERYPNAQTREPVAMFDDDMLAMFETFRPKKKKVSKVLFKYRGEIPLTEEKRRSPSPKRKSPVKTLLNLSESLTPTQRGSVSSQRQKSRNSQSI